MTVERSVVGSSPRGALLAALDQVVAARRDLAGLIVAHLPMTGETVGNTSMRRLTKTVTSGDYLGARSELVRVGLVRLGYGRGARWR